MINLNELHNLYPITFHRKNGSSVTFTSLTTRSGEGEIEFSVDSFDAYDYAVRHNRYNRLNSPALDFYLPPFVNGEVQRAAINGRLEQEIPLVQAIGRGYRMTKRYIESAIEDMPIGSQVVGIKRDEDEWDDLKMKVRRIEVHDDTIVLLAHHSMHGVGYGAEVNIKRGTLVRYTKG